eukprot:403353843
MEQQKHQHNDGHEQHNYSPFKLTTSPINFVAMKEETKRQSDAAKRKLWLVAFVSIFFIIAQLIGGYMAQSIAIFTDSAHLASDLIGFAISIISMIMAEKPANKVLTFGYHRAEVLGTLVSVIFIWGLTIWLVQEATMRIIDPVEVKGGTMVIVAVMGLIFNLIQMKILHSGDGHYHLGGGHDHDHGHSHGDHDHHHGHKHDHGHDHKDHSHDHKHSSAKKKLSYGVDNHELAESLIDKEHQHHDHHHDHDHKHEQKGEKRMNINVTSAYLHVLGDLLMSVGVIIAAVIIYFKPTYQIADPLCTYLFSVIILFTTIPVVKECTYVLLEGSPESIDIEGLAKDLSSIEGVVEVHDLHVWAISVNKFSLSAHIISETPQKSLSAATDLCRRKYNLYHTTLQVESVEESQHYFKCENDLHE